MSINIAKYSKAIAALAAAVGVAVADNVLDLNDVVNVGLALLVAFGVYAAPANKG